MATNFPPKKKLLFVYTDFSSFVQNDYHLLAEEYLITKYHYLPVRGIAKNSYQMIKQFAYLLFVGWKFDSFFCWFADYHAFLPTLLAKLYRKKAVIVMGGYDVARIRSLNYGAFCSSFRGWFCARSMRLATCLVTVSGYVDRKTAILAPQTRRKMIYNCLGYELPDAIEPREKNCVLTVGLIQNERTFYLKGMDTFLETARLLPDVRFEAVGIKVSAIAHLLMNLPENLQLHERVGKEELQQYYNQAAIYCQLSRSESFGVSIVEAMAAGAFPLVTNVGGMPEVTGNAGIIVPRDAEAIAKIIRQKLAADRNEASMNSRARVKLSFLLPQRKAALLDLMRSL